MAHLDTAYKLGALQAQADFEQEIQKVAGPGDVIPAAPATVPRGSVAEAVRGSTASGLARSTGGMAQNPVGAGKAQTFAPQQVQRSGGMSDPKFQAQLSAALGEAPAARQAAGPASRPAARPPTAVARR